MSSASLHDDRPEQPRSDEITPVDNAYSDATDCPICPMLATDRDDALAEVDALRTALDQVQNVLRNIDRAEAAVEAFKADADRGRRELRLILADAGATQRPNVMTVAASHLLNVWGRELGQAFPTAIGVLHVGSSFGREVGWRDVDVRIVLTDEDYDRLYRIVDPERLNVALSLWGERTTGLPIDCQVQPIRESRKYDGQPRNGIRA